MDIWNVMRRLLGDFRGATAHRSESGAQATTASPPISPEHATFQSMSTDRALWRIAQRGLPISTVIDVGASNGMWSAVCERHFPNANYLLVEAQRVHEPGLEAFCRARPNAQYVLAAAGDFVGEIYFDDSDPFGGLASKTKIDGARTVVPVTTLDVETRTRKLPGPYLLKLDTHGFEVPILEGAQDVLSKADLVIIEVYNFRLTGDTLLFHEMIGYMAAKGFSVIDIAEPLWRERDLAFWQMDMFFQKASRPEFAYNAYR